MSESRKLRVLLVDDQPRRLYGLEGLFGEQVDFVFRDPFEVEPDDIIDVDLISVDEFLGDEWLLATESGEHSSPATTRNRDGIAVAASFRSQTRRAITHDEERTAVTLHTGALEEIAAGLPRARQEALTAAQHDLEWVFYWEESSFGSRLISLARAAQGAAEYAKSDSGDFGASWLTLPNQHWTDTARAQIEDCRPPALALAQNTTGRSLVRWLAHRVLPYPTFLLDRSHAANLLGISLDAFDTLSTTDYFTTYGSAYTGPLHEFLGRRWWRAGLQQLLADQDRFQWDTAGDRASALREASGLDLEALTSQMPVVAYDADGHVTSIDADPNVSVRLQADGWPVFADDPWALVELAAEDPALRGLVAQSERHRLEAHS
ncbi:hypothetical protein [Microbacterium maritypicum]